MLCTWSYLISVALALLQTQGKLLLLLLWRHGSAGVHLAGVHKVLRVVDLHYALLLLLLLALEVLPAPAPAAVFVRLLHLWGLLLLGILLAQETRQPGVVEVACWVVLLQMSVSLRLMLLLLVGWLHEQGRSRRGLPVLLGLLLLPPGGRALPPRGSRPMLLVLVLVPPLRGRERRAGHGLERRVLVERNLLLLL